MKNVKSMKGMKKSAFISTFALIAILIVAVSVGTWAWFTTNDTVTASSVTMSAATVDGISLGIGWTDTIAKSGGSSIVFGNNTVTTDPGVDEEDPEDDIITIVPIAINPMAPKAAPVVGTTTFAAFTAATNFYGSSVKPNGTFSADGIGRTPIIFNDGTAGTPVDEFYIANNAEANVAVTIKLTLTNADAAMKDALRVAVFVEGKLAVILCGGDVTDTIYGEIKEGEIADPTEDESNMEVYTAEAYDAAGYELISSLATGSATIQIVAWFDGASVLNENAGQGVTVGLTFVGGPVA